MIQDDTDGVQMEPVNGTILHRVWIWYVALFGGNRRVAVLAALPMVAAVTGIVVRGFQYDTWAWTEYYSDGYYYLAFAKHAARGEFFTYANVFPSSGIHPLHWLHLAAVYALTGGNQSWMFPILFATYALAFTITTWAVLYTLRALGVGAGLLLFVVLAMTYGNYLADALDIPLLVPVIYTNFVNLMPSWLLITSLSLLIAAGVRQLRSPSSGGWILIVLASVMAAWSRVDYLIIVLPFVVVVAWRSRTLLRWQRVVLIGAAPVAVAAWSLVLVIATGIPVPTSGAVKNALAHATEIGAGDAITFLSQNFLDSAGSLHALIALAGMLACAVLLILAARSRQIRRSPVAWALAAVLGGMFVLFLYHMTLTFPGDVGGWYFRPYRVLMLFVGIFALGSVAWLQTLGRVPIIDRALKVIAVIAIAWIVVSHLNASGAASDSLVRAHLVRDVVQQLDEVVDSDATFFDGTDGAFGWYSEYTTYHIKGMANTPDYVDTARKIRLLDLAEMIPVYASYIDKTGIDYVVTYARGAIVNLEDECRAVLSAVAYAENRSGDRFSNAYAARSGDWLRFLECQTSGVR